VVAILIWIANRTRRKRARISLAFLGVLVVGLLLWYAFIIRPHQADFDSVVTTLAAVEPSENNILLRVYAGLREGACVDLIQYPLGLLLAFGLAVFMRDRRRRALVLGCALWTAAYLLMIGVRGHFPPRYYSAIVPPIAVLIAIGLTGLPTSGRRKYATFAVAVLVAGTVVHNGYRIIDYMLHPKYSLHQMGRSIGEHVAKDDVVGPFLLGHTAGTVGLIAGLPSVGENLGSGDEAFKIRTHRPTHYVSMGPAGVARPATTQALRAAGYEWELIERYDVLGNYSHKARTGVYFYRLHKPDTP
jgi:hypothetical protein